MAAFDLPLPTEPAPRMARWRWRLFAAMCRRASSDATLLSLPPERSVVHDRTVRRPG